MRTRLLVSGFVVALVAVASGPAQAQREGMRTAPFEMPVIAPGNSFGGELMLGTMEPSPAGDNVTQIALELFGTAELTSRLSLRGRLPFAHTSDDNNSASSLGNLTVGLDYLLSTGRGATSVSAWSLGGSVSLPTASDTGDSRAAALLHGYFRVPYPGRYDPDTTAIRLYGQFRLDARKVFLQLQGGINHLIIDNFEDLMLLRFGTALGVSVGRTTTLLAELTFLTDFLDDSTDDWWTNLDLGARFGLNRNLQLGARLFVPLDDTSRDLDIIGVAVDLRTQF